MVTVALDIDPEKARPWIERAQPSHPSLIDRAHHTDQRLGFNNVPMAVWIDESGMLVRPAESAAIERSPLRDVEIDPSWPPEIRDVMIEAQRIPDISGPYRAAIADWIDKGADSAFAMGPDEVVAASLPRNRSQAEAAACFELGQHLYRLHEGAKGREAAAVHWRRAHALDPSNWTYKRQAWTLETTAEGEPSDLLQPPTDVYEGSWLADVQAIGGGGNYISVPSFISRPAGDP